MRAARTLTPAFLLGVLVLSAHAGRRNECERACGAAIRSCMMATAQGLRACREQVIGQCAREGISACWGAPLPPDAGSCYEGVAPACGGSCPLREFRCVPNPAGGCNCEAPACGRSRKMECGGVCRNLKRVCVLRAGRCKCV